MTNWSQAALITPNTVLAFDDGFAENAVGVGTPQTTIFMNGFSHGTEMTVLGAEIAFGPNPGDGAPLEVYLWSDPNNDGNPIDAVLVDTLLGTVSDENNMGFAFPLGFAQFTFNTPLLVPANTFFFIGYQTTGFALEDTDSTSVPASWIFSNFDTNLIDPSDISAIAGGGNLINPGVPPLLPGVYPIRALTFIPEPSTYIAIITGVGLVGFVAFRRFRSKATAEDSEVEA